MAPAVIYASEAPDQGDVRGARRALRAALSAAAVDDGLLERGLLVLSELVTNAVRHARSAFTVAVEADVTRVRIEVFDRDTRLPVAVAADDDAMGGRGLQIVGAYASEWGAGTEERDGIRGKVVWAEIRPEPGTPPP
jgi:anti-sigma regulatory factor (Ser/Thr protein kinase)